ncbi:MAG: hypothetical protein CMK99_21295 [Pseudomonas sp.]|jgi:hypothetical protein|nr:hypothetical protein [Pseudomonas chengduensis]MAX93238.1 hypothetical protein [Pseudomonas sp.]UZT79828.1 hypothetical protein OF113_07180 [Pseudomonas chengduensis]HBS80583.1 hypothetical protein [Pseudomonas sp.]|tara:strand:- start:4376 stop:4645 length:270 start_codon:yes stop_codon:yes gene_type:complete
MESIQQRARTLIAKAGFDLLIKHSDIGLNRWHTVRFKDVRMSTEELEVLVKLYPQYVMWLASGQTAPEIGQTSPDYDEANRNLSQPNAG